MTTLITLPSPDALPAGERHISSGNAASLPDALQDMEDHHLLHFVTLDHAYHTRSDGKYWFVLKNGK